MVALLMRILGLVLALIVSSCGPVEDDQYGAGAPLADVSGAWSISGTGVLEDCIDRNFNSDRFTLSAMRLRVTQNRNAMLSANSPRGGFEFSGAVTGERVDFVTRETTAGETIEFRFVGQANEIGVIRGDFQGDGPSTCRSTGRFVVKVD